MSNTARLFIAVKIDPPRPLRKMLSRLGLLGRVMKPLKPDNLHLTLKFLGDTDLNLTPQVAAAMETAAAGRAACSLRLRGLGAFPHARRPSVIWAGVENGETLTAIADSLGELLLPLGFAQERRPFHPHVTLARIRTKPPDELAVLLEAEQAADFGTAPVDSVELYQSELDPAGTRYTVLSRAELSGA